jgi:hypothetical protein
MAKRRTIKKEKDTTELDPEVKKMLEDDSSYFDEDAEIEDLLFDDDEEELEELDYDNLEITPISALKEGDSDVTIQGIIDAIGNKSNAIDYVCVQTMVRDETGEIKVTFWNEDVAKVAEGKKVLIPKGYVSSFRGQLQFNSNRRYGVEFK